MRILLVASVLAALAAGCVITGGPDCPAACRKALACEGLDRVWQLNCSSVSSSCLGELGLCADCILASTCDDLKHGLCDVTCGPLTNPVLLPLEEARPLADPRLVVPAP